jgi:hypothetical membrane protein
MATPPRIRYITGITGIAGCLAVIIGITLSAIHFEPGTGYSPLNHFISELGKKSAGKFSDVFNLCLMAGGVLLTLFTLSLGLSMRQKWVARIATCIGILATLSFSMVGYYSADSWTAHKIAAIVFFSGAMVATNLFGYVIYKYNTVRWHKTIAIQSCIITLVYLLIFCWPKDLMVEAVKHPDQFIRPVYWDLTILEWIYSTCICNWIFTTATAYLLSKPAVHQNQAG